MTRQEARQAIGRIVAWPNMDARIDQTSIILERIGKHGIATVSFRIGYNPIRFVTYKPVTELEALN